MCHDLDHTSLCRTTCHDLTPVLRSTFSNFSCIVHAICFFIYSINLAMASKNQTVLDLLRRLQQQNAANRGLEEKCDSLKYEVRKTEEHVSAKVALLKQQLESAGRVTAQLTNEITELEAKKQKILTEEELLDEV